MNHKFSDSSKMTLTSHGDGCLLTSIISDYAFIYYCNKFSFECQIDKHWGADICTQSWMWHLASKDSYKLHFCNRCLVNIPQNLDLFSGYCSVLTRPWSYRPVWNVLTCKTMVLKLGAYLWWQYNSKESTNKSSLLGWQPQNITNMVFRSDLSSVKFHYLLCIIKWFCLW